MTVENKLKQSISALVSSDGEGLPRDFGYGAMEHNLVHIRLEDKEIVGYVFFLDLYCRLTGSWSNDLHTSVSGLCMSWDKKRVLVSCGPVRPAYTIWAILTNERYCNYGLSSRNYVSYGNISIISIMVDLSFNAISPLSKTVSS